jgi:tetratricopeptide (TPR) repeat protein
MNKTLSMILTAAAGLFVGLLLGYTIGVNKGLEAARGGAAGQGAAAMPSPGMPSPGMPPAGMPHPRMPSAGGPLAGVPAREDPQAVAAAQQRIAMNQQLLARDPKNVTAWIALGNDYFDTHQAQQAIDAYAAALKLQPANPDVLTDQGVMYEQLADYDHALANFDQAQKIDPRHVQSAFNLGVIWGKYKNQPAKAAVAWKRVLELAPNSPQAAEARQNLAALGQ